MGGAAYLIQPSSEITLNEARQELSVRVSLGQRAANTGQQTVQPTPPKIKPKPQIPTPKKIKPKPEAIKPKPISLVDSPTLMQTHTKVQKPAPKPNLPKTVQFNTIGSNSQGSHNTARMTQETGTAQDVGAPQDELIYDALVRKHLRRFKRYPAMAKRKREQGTTIIAFSLDRQGELLSSSIHKSAGSKRLDRAALQQIDRASPFPMPPDTIRWDVRDYTVKIDFTLETQ